MVKTLLKFVRGKEFQNFDSTAMKEWQSISGMWMELRETVDLLLLGDGQPGF